MLARALFVSLGFAAIASAQIWMFGSEDTDTDFPSSCTSICDPYENDAAACVTYVASRPESESDQAALSCFCTDDSARKLETCASCILSASSNPSTSKSAQMAQELAISIAQECGTRLNIDGVNSTVSSILQGPAGSSTSASASSASNSQGTRSATGTAAPTGSQDSQDSGATLLRLGCASLVVAAAGALIA